MMLEAVIALWIALWITLAIFGIILWLQYRAIRQLTADVTRAFADIGVIINVLAGEQDCTTGLIHIQRMVLNMLQRWTEIDGGSVCDE